MRKIKGKVLVSLRLVSKRKFNVCGHLSFDCIARRLHAKVELIWFVLLLKDTKILGNPYLLNFIIHG